MQFSTSVVNHRPINSLTILESYWETRKCFWCCCKEIWNEGWLHKKKLFWYCQCPGNLKKKISMSSTKALTVGVKKKGNVMFEILFEVENFISIETSFCFQVGSQSMKGKNKETFLVINYIFYIICCYAWYDTWYILLKSRSINNRQNMLDRTSDNLVCFPIFCIIS